MNGTKKNSAPAKKLTAFVMAMTTMSAMAAFPTILPNALNGAENSIVMTASAASDYTTIVNTGKLTTGKQYFSPNNRYMAVMQGDGNMVLYATNASTRKPICAIWSSGTQCSNGFAQLQGDGNFVVYNSSGKALWSACTNYAGSGCSLRVTNDGELTVVKSNGTKVWSSRHCLNTNGSYGQVNSMKVGDCISSPNGQYRAILQGDGNFVVYTFKGQAVWSTGTGGKLNPSNLTMQTDGNLVLYSTGNNHWCTGVTPMEKGNHRLELDNNGHLNVINASGVKIWSTESRPFIWPVPSSNLLNSCFLEGGHAGSYHGGIDIGGSKGDTIVAARDGKVIAVMKNCCSHNYGTPCNCGGGGGNYVVLEHSINGQKYWTTYMHMTDVSVSKDNTVKAGQKIGTMGSTGSSTGMHLDFTIRTGGSDVWSAERLDPCAYTTVPSNMIHGGSSPSCCNPYINLAIKYRNVLFDLAAKKVL